MSSGSTAIDRIRPGAGATASTRKPGRKPPFNLALVYFGLGDLERALAADSQMMAWIGRDAIFDPVRSEPRFVALLKKMRFNR